MSWWCWWLFPRCGVSRDCWKKLWMLLLFWMGSDGPLLVWSVCLGWIRFVVPWGRSVLFVIWELLRRVRPNAPRFGCLNPNPPFLAGTIAIRDACVPVGRLSNGTQTITSRYQYAEVVSLTVYFNFIPVAYRTLMTDDPIPWRPFRLRDGHPKDQSSMLHSRARTHVCHQPPSTHQNSDNDDGQIKGNNTIPNRCAAEHI